MKFYECCDLTKKVYLVCCYRNNSMYSSKKGNTPTFPLYFMDAHVICSIQTFENIPSLNNLCFVPFPKEENGWPTYCSKKL